MQTVFIKIFKVKNSIKKKFNFKTGKEYENFQAVFSYNSNSIEGNRLELDQVRNLYKGKMPKARETGILSIDLLNRLKLDNDIAEVKNHFECVDYVIDTINDPLSHDESVYGKLKYIFGLNLFYDGILKERISVTEKAILKMKQYLSEPDIHYSNEKEKKKIIELLEKFVKNSLVIHLKNEEEKGYTQEIVALLEYENK